MLTNWIWRLLARFRSEEGQALAEYGLIVALIAVVCILTLTAVGVAISGNLGDDRRGNARGRPQDKGPDVMRVPRGPIGRPPLRGPARPSGLPTGRGDSSAIFGK